jgi:hypothetical protein
LEPTVSNIYLIPIVSELSPTHLSPTHLNRLIRNFKDDRKKLLTSDFGGAQQMVKYVVIGVTLEEEMGGDRPA